MKADSCSETTDAKRIELKSGLLEPGKHCRDYGFLVLAGILTGLGVGLFIDHTGSGFLIGLGLGLIGSELVPHLRKPQEGECLHLRETNVILLLKHMVSMFGRDYSDYRSRVRRYV